MTVYGIDPSTTSVGWVIYTDGKPVADGYSIPEGNAPSQKLLSITQLLDDLNDAYEQPDVVACERMFMSPFQGNASALLNVIPKQIEAWVVEQNKHHPCTFLQVHNATVKKTVGANAIQKQQKKLKTKEAVYACVEQYMSEKAKALPKAHRYDVSDAHAIALTAIHQLTTAPK